MRVLVILILAFVVELPAHSAELKTAQQALAAGDYATAYQRYIHDAENSPLAQFTLGLFEQEGWGRPKNSEAACDWFEKAAQKNVPAAQQFFGDCLINGIGRQADGQAAVSWYKKAAESGIPYALCSAAHAYITGKHIEKNIDLGLALCTAAAQAESPSAMLRLADYYREGTDVPQNLTAARHWYLQAAERHNAQAQYRVGLMLSEGLGGPADLPQALFWLEHAASHGYADAYLPVAILYANTKPEAQTGVLSPENLAKIYMWNVAAKATTTQPDQRAEIDRIDKLVLAVMPVQWKENLDKRVAQHLSTHNHPLF